jgi:negative regulator of sigma-B (phosphoserine phosphatase)
MSDGSDDLVIEWGSAGVALEGESGDLHVVAPFSQGALVAVIDGLGHGPEAAAAAREAGGTLASSPAESLPMLVQRCHDALRKTRGAVMTLASFDARLSSMTWMAVGNVEGILVRGADSRSGREAITLRGGVVGYQLPALRASSVAISRGDTLFLASDGIRSGFVSGLALLGSPEDMAKSILERYARGTDDALILVVRYLGAKT